MGMGYRVFLVDQSDRLHRISQKLFDELLSRKPGKTVPDPFIGQDRVKYVNVVYETERRKPLAIVHVDCHILPLDPDGMMDSARTQEVLQLLCVARSPLDALDALDSEARPRGSVVDGTRIFAEKRLKHEWEWRPSFELQEQISEAVFG